MKHLISETEGNVQKDWWKMEGNCFLLDPTHKHKPFPKLGGFFFLAVLFVSLFKVLIYQIIVAFQKEYIYNINMRILTKRYRI